VAKRLDTRLESEGAEFLVLGQLLIAGIEATKAYRNFEGFDLYASNPTAGKTCRIQVKRRWATDHGGFPIKNLAQIGRHADRSTPMPPANRPLSCVRGIR
jgi:hypothetical protein